MKQAASNCFLRETTHAWRIERTIGAARIRQPVEQPLRTVGHQPRGATHNISYQEERKLEALTLPQIFQRLAQLAHAHLRIGPDFDLLVQYTVLNQRV